MGNHSDAYSATIIVALIIQGASILYMAYRTKTLGSLWFLSSVFLGPLSVIGFEISRLWGLGKTGLKGSK